MTIIYASPLTGRFKHDTSSVVNIDNQYNRNTGWWLLLTPLKNDGVPQLGLLYIVIPNIWKKCSKPTTRITYTVTYKLPSGKR